MPKKTPSKRPAPTPQRAALQVGSADTQSDSSTSDAPTRRSLFPDTVEEDNDDANVSLSTTQLNQIARQVVALLREDTAASPSPHGASPDTPGLMSTATVPPTLVLPPRPEGPGAPAPDEQGPPLHLNATWIDYLTEQRLVNINFSKRDREELRTLLLVVERPPVIRQDRQFLSDRLQLYTVVGHRGWSAALTALPDWDLKRLGIDVPAAPSPAPTVQPAAAAAPAPPQQPLPYPATTVAYPLHANPYMFAQPGPPRRRRRRKPTAVTSAQ